MIRMGARCAVALVGLAMACGAPAHDWPARPITIVTSSGPGGQSDAVLRTLAKELEGPLGQQVVVENKTGANTTLAAQHAARAKPDGYTFLFLSMGGHAPVFTKNNSLLLNEAMLPVGNVYSSNWLLFVRKGVAAQSLEQLAAWSKDNDLKVGGATPSVRLAMAMLNEALAQAGKAPVQYRFIPYRNDPAVLTAMHAGDVDVAFASPSVFMPQLEAGTVRALLNTSSERAEPFMDVPTPADLGIKFTPSWDIGIWAPKGTSPAIIGRLSDEIQKVTQTGDFKERLSRLGVKAETSSPEAFLQKYEAALQFWLEGARLTNFEPQ